MSQHTVKATPEVIYSSDWKYCCFCGVLLKGDMADCITNRKTSNIICAECAYMITDTVARDWNFERTTKKPRTP